MIGPFVITRRAAFAVHGVAELSFTALTAPEVLAIQNRLEKGYRSQPMVDPDLGLTIVATSGAHAEPHYGPGHWLVELGERELAHRFTSDVDEGMPTVDGPVRREVGRAPDGSLRYFVLPDTAMGAMAERTVVDLRRSVVLPPGGDLRWRGAPGRVCRELNAEPVQARKRASHCLPVF